MRIYFNRLNDLKSDIEKNKPNNAQIQFLVRLIKLSKSNYWLNQNGHDNLTGALDGVLYHCISKNDELIKALLQNMHLVVNEATGTKLADELANSYPTIDFEENILNNMFDDVSQESIGAYAFAGMWLRRVQFTKKEITFGKIYLTLQCVEALLNFEGVEEKLKGHLPDENEFSNSLISGIVEYCQIAIRKEAFRTAHYGAITVTLITYLTEKLGIRSSSTLAKNVSRDQIWPELANHFDKLSDADQDVLSKYISKYPKIIDHIKPEQLATLSQFNNLHMLSYLANNNVNQLENVISELIARPYFGEVINFWLKKLTKKNW